ncbi:MAG: MerR family transcriptional regulator [Oscillospiraceae bacterium]|nr:MerR family transcriptional regulator [Oscillospiraceae bacterium]
MRIKDVEAIVGITKKNIRFYEKEGLLSPGRNMENSYRDYSEADIEILKQIKFFRKLNMPVSEIKALLEGKISLQSSLRRHSIVIDEQRKSLLRSEEICEKIVEEGVALSDFDTDAYLLHLENMEKEGAVFRNIVKNDVMKKFFGPVFACALIVALSAAALVLLLLFNKTDPAPEYMLICFCAVLAAVALGTLVAPLFRIREIRKGEEDDLGNY